MSRTAGTALLDFPWVHRASPRKRMRIDCASFGSQYLKLAQGARGKHAALCNSCAGSKIAVNK